MRLRKVDILGFKSFRDRTTVELSEGMTSIVGPNGCGKSNVVDAIKWAMGDMSPKSLRGASMSDVIFAGSSQYRPMGMAEVTLTFENSGGLPEETEWGDSIPREFRELTEIAVTRRLHRSGDSEYLINKTPCRLMDIQNLLAGTGVGKQGYSIIEQNQVGFIVSSKPSERRLLIEEASGITRYKSQRDRTERRLSKAEENLQRVNDILSEIQKRIRSLERQAKRAAQHRRFVDELKAVEIGLLLKKRQDLLAKLQKLSDQKEDAGTEKVAAQSCLSKHEGDLNEQKVEAFAADKAHAAATEAFYKLETRLNISRNKRDSAKSTIEDAKQRREAAISEAEMQFERRQRLRRELDEVRAKLDELKDQDEREETLVDNESRLQEVAKRLDLREAELSSSKSSLDSIRSEYHRVIDRSEWIEEQTSELSEREAQITESIEGLEKEVDERRIGLESAKKKSGEADANLERIQKAQVSFESEVDRLKDLLREAESELRTRRNSLVDARTQLESLEAMAARGEGFGEAVQEVLRWAIDQGREDVLGPVGNFLQVDSDWETIVVSALGDRISDIVVTSREVAFNAIEAIESDGRVTFLVDSDFEPSRLVEDLIARVELVDRLGDVEDDDAVEIWATPTGELVFSNGRVVAGQDSDASAMVLERQRRISELKIQCEALEEECSDLSEAAEELETQLHEAREKLQNNARKLEHVRVDARSARNQVESEEREFDRVQKSLERIRTQMVPVLRRQGQLEEERDQLAERLEILEDDKKTRALEVTALDERVSSLRKEVEMIRTSVTEQRVEVAQARERRKSLEESLERLTRSIESAAKLAERYKVEAEQMQQRIADVEAELSRATGELSESETGIEDAKKEADAARARVDAASARLAELEAGMSDKRMALEKTVDLLQQLEIESRETRVSVEHLDEQLIESHGISFHEAAAFVESIEIPRDEWQSRRDYLKRRLDSMGPVNAMAEQEYEEAQDRENFLVEQKDDLERSASDLRKAIAEMDRESRRRFKETYDAVNEKFQEIFPKLFQGGYGKLILTEPDDILNTGVDIEVCPPGKRMQSMSLLSGGEKALTAVSLIFSIFMLKPTPFSILDEVDAPLDEANVGRFAEMVRRMSESSQMIVITHSRRTMEAAELLYGVTMEEPGVSKIVSVRLSDIDDRLAS